MKVFGWSLYDIDRTDLESLMPFIGRFAAKKGRKRGGKTNQTAKVYCDDPRARWL